MVEEEPALLDVEELCWVELVEGTERGEGISKPWDDLGYWRTWRELED